MKNNAKENKRKDAVIGGKASVRFPRIGGCGNGWTCDRCPNVGCPANERN